MENKKSSTMLVKSVDRAITILETLSQQEGPLSLLELSAEVHMHPSTVRRLLTTLMHHNLVAQDGNRGSYQIGLKIFELAYRVINQMDLLTKASPELKKLRNETNETVHLAVLNHGDVVYIAKEESERAIRMYSAIGRRAPVYCTALGKVLLADLPEYELDRALARVELQPYTARTITSLYEFKQHLIQVRIDGYAIDDAEHEETTRCVAAPILDHTGKVLAAISVTAPTHRLTLEAARSLGPIVAHHANMISQSMGYTNIQRKEGSNID